MDYVLLIQAPEKLQISRIMKRDNTTKENVALRIKNQWPTDKISKMADWVITNNGKTLILQQVLEIHNQLIELNKLHG